MSVEPIGHLDRPELPSISREELEALHEEVSRLPERYRVPVVLCELEGLTYHEAALRLRCPVSTIGIRLKRARERLRVRLTQRGLAPTAGLIGALLGGEAASALVPSRLVTDTVQVATRFAASKAAANGLVSTGVLALTEGVLRSMALAPLKLATGLVLAVALVATVGWVVRSPNGRSWLGRCQPGSGPSTRRGPRRFRPLQPLPPNQTPSPAWRPGSSPP